MRIYFSCNSAWLALRTVALGMAWLLGPIAARAQINELPKELEGLGVTEHLNDRIPAQLEFANDNERYVKLGQYFTGKKPVIFTFNYYSCPSICSAQLNGLVEALKELDWTPGAQFDIVTLSFDQTETPQLAKVKKENYIDYYGRPAAAGGWHFLTGKKENISALTNAVGYRFRWNEQESQWMHAPVIVICTPDGRISRYLYGVMYEPKTLRLALLEASEGKIGTTLEQILLWCYRYDSHQGQYTLAAMRVMQLGGGLTVMVLAIVLLTLRRLSARRQKAELAGQQG